MSKPIDRDIAALLSLDSLTSVQTKDSEVLKRLAALHRYLETIPQEDDAPTQLLPVASQFVQPWLMKHRSNVCVCEFVFVRARVALPFHSVTSQAVKTYLACCIAEILRLFVPEPPYSAEIVKVRVHARCVHACWFLCAS